MTREHPISAVTFDVTGTLIHSPYLAEIYSEAFARHGVTAEPDRIASLFPVVWKEFDCSTRTGRCRFAAHRGGARGWWTSFVARMIELLEAPKPDRFLAAELWSRFARADSWEVYPEVEEVLRDLHGAGVRLGVVSNWDERLPRLLNALGFSCFDAVVYSSALGVAKPSPAIFSSALDQLGAVAGHALHVGDSQINDVEGARAAGMSALLVDRSGRGGDLADLSTLPSVVGASRDPGRG